jgi:hypothetical protein
MYWRRKFSSAVEESGGLASRIKDCSENLARQVIIPCFHGILDSEVVSATKSVELDSDFILSGMIPDINTSYFCGDFGVNCHFT